MDDSAVLSLKQRFEVHYDPALVDKPAELTERLTAARAVIVRNRTRVSAELLEKAPLLTCVGRLGVGLDNIDLDACQNRSVTVFPATGANNLSVAEYVITTAMALHRKAYHSTREVILGNWPRQACAGSEFSGSVLGLIGYGLIARETAALANKLGVRAIGFDPLIDKNSEEWASTGRRELDELLREADTVSLHVPLTPSTRNMIGEREIALMKPNAVLINSSRGGVVDESALIRALRSGKIGGVALDVFENEPLTAGDAAKFAGVPNLILTPHVAGVTEQSNVRVSAMIAEKISTHLSEAHV